MKVRSSESEFKKADCGFSSPLFFLSLCSGKALVCDKAFLCDCKLPVLEARTLLCCGPGQAAMRWTEAAAEAALLSLPLELKRRIERGR